jgi:hypothetical protein
LNKTQFLPIIATSLEFLVEVDIYAHPGCLAKWRRRSNSLYLSGSRFFFSLQNLFIELLALTHFVVVAILARLL